ncbi:MAG: acyl-CoA-binding protein [Xanthomonadales bacterium]|nr:acyl-CoA-binding protein [Xanthomonadales bacterium]NNL95655.1 acyl-CoA-binding protein [Xanthomonadales bacterium]
MPDLHSRFEKASLAARNLPQKPDDETMLQLYALYKQASVGDAGGDKPGLFDFVGQAKYSAWEKLAGMPPEDARQAYIDLVASLGGDTGD